MAQPTTVRQISNHATHAETRLPTLAMEHADAVESAYEVLQLLHDRGVLNLMRGLLGAGDRVIENLIGKLEFLARKQNIVLSSNHGLNGAGKIPDKAAEQNVIARQLQ